MKLTSVLAAALNTETWFEQADEVFSYTQNNLSSFANTVSLIFISYNHKRREMDHSGH